MNCRSSKYNLSKKISRISQTGSEAIVAFSGVDSINEALKLVGYSLYGDLPAVKTKPEASVLGFSVFDAQGNCWGKVKAQPQYSLNQLLEVEDEQSGEIFYVPWHESIVKKIDRRTKTITIDPPAGITGFEPVRFSVITIFPELIRNFLNFGLLEKAIKNGLITVDVYDLREFSRNKHRKVDDRPLGGGPGMVLMPDPLFRAVEFDPKGASGAGDPFFRLRTHPRSEKDQIPGQGRII